MRGIRFQMYGDKKMWVQQLWEIIKDGELYFFFNPIEYFIKSPDLGGIKIMRYNGVPLGEVAFDGTYFYMELEEEYPELFDYLKSRDECYDVQYV